MPVTRLLLLLVKDQESFDAMLGSFHGFLTHDGEKRSMKRYFTAQPFVGDDC